MSSEGSPDQKQLDGSGLAIAIVAGTWHAEIAENLIASAINFCESSGARAEVIRVPGSFEVPLAANAALDAGFDAVVALGVIIKGDTPHFDFVSSGVTHGLMDLMLTTKKPIGFGILTCENIEQARLRSGLPGSISDKGIEAASAALQMAILIKEISL
jgi:6,7-dimethyl-8-ribityllumazine synthase